VLVEKVTGNLYDLIRFTAWIASNVHDYTGSIFQVLQSFLELFSDRRFP